MAEASDIIEIDIPSVHYPKVRFVRSEDGVTFDDLEAPFDAKHLLSYLGLVIKDVNGKKDESDFTFGLPDLMGNPRMVTLPSLNGVVDNSYALEYQNIFQIILDWQDPNRGNFAYIRRTKLDPSESASEIDKIRAHTARWDAAWDGSPEKEALTTFLQKHSRDMKKVNKVIGVGLGRPGGQAFDEHHRDKSTLDEHEQSYFQHLTLLHIANVLKDSQGTAGNKVLVQDPAYTDLYKLVLTDMAKKYGRGLEFEYVDDPEAFLQMDEQTVVFHCLLGFDVGEVSIAMAEVAGLMGGCIEKNHQQQLRGKVRYETVNTAPLRLLNSSMKHGWRQKCEGLEIKVRKGVPWYGTRFPTYFYVKTKHDGPG